MIACEGKVPIAEYGSWKASRVAALALLWQGAGTGGIMIDSGGMMTLTGTVRDGSERWLGSGFGEVAGAVSRRPDAPGAAADVSDLHRRPDRPGRPQEHPAAGGANGGCRLRPASSFHREWHKEPAPLDRRPLAEANRLVGDAQGFLVIDDTALPRSTGERKYYLSNLPADTAIKTLARAIKARWVFEQAHQQLKPVLSLSKRRNWALTTSRADHGPDCTDTR